MTLDGGSPSLRRSAAGVVIALLLLAHLAPVWTVAHWPSQDGPAHAYNAVLLRELNRPDRPAYHRFFQANRHPVPNWAASLLTCGLLTVASPAVADKLIVSGYLLGFYAAAVYAVRGVRPGARYEPLVVLPFAYNLFVFMGFYNFCFSLPALLMVFGYWLRRAAAPSPIQLVALTILSTALYFCHLVSFGIEACFLGWMALWPALTGGGTVGDRLRRLGRSAVPLLALLPAVALSLLFLGRQPLGTTGPPVSLTARSGRFFLWANALSRFNGAVSTGLTLAFIAATAVVIVARRRQPHRWQAGDALLATAVVTALGSMVSPDVLSGGSYVISRLNLLALLTWAVWLAGQPLPARLGPILRAIGALATGVMLVTNGRVIRIEDRYVSELLTAGAAIPANATVMPLSYAAKLDQSPRDRPPFRWVDCMLHAGSWVAIDRQAADVTNYEAWTGYFPILFRPGLDPMATVHDMTPGRYEQVVGFRPEYVLLWTGGVAPNRELDAEIAADLARGYRLTFRSPGDGFAQVYQRVDGHP